MKRLSLLAIITLTQLALAAPSGAEGLPPAPTTPAARVQTALLAPLAAREDHQGKFSRARMPPQERRVRVLDATPQLDASGAAFFRFAVDARHGFADPSSDEGWQVAAMTGCVYAESGEVFVKIGDRHRPAAFLLGKNLKPAAEQTCTAVQPAS